MSTQGGIIERKEIGIGISLIGEFNNVEVIDGKLQLKKLNQNSYYENGYFISRTIDIGDNFKEFDNIISTIESVDDTLVKISTRTSSDDNSFSTWEYLNEDNKINSPKNRYIQLRIELNSIKATTEKDIPLSDYVEGNNNFVEEYTNPSDNSTVLKLKDIIYYNEIKDDSWTEEGSLYRKKIMRDDWLRIDRLEVE